MHLLPTRSTVRILVFLLGIALVCGGARAAQTVRVYGVGNSLTGNVNFSNFAQMAQSAGNSAVYGFHVQPGQSLDFIFQNPNAPDQITQSPYGAWDNALANFTWDAVSIQPFNRALDGPTGDLTSIGNFVNAIQQHNSQAQIYVYQTWPTRDERPTFNYHDQWLETYNGTNTTARTRDYFDQLMTQSRTQFASLADPIRMIPVGEVLFELNERMHGGLVPGYDDISVAYADAIHMNAIGSFIVASTWYATIYGEDPSGLSAAPWGLTDPVLTGQIQDSVWQVVSTNPWTGVPEPASMSLIAMCGAMLLGARRR